MEAIDEAYAIRLIQASSIFGGSHNWTAPIAHLDHFRR
jgi:hypothetical protein